MESDEDKVTKTRNNPSIVPHVQGFKLGDTKRFISAGRGGWKRRRKIGAKCGEKVE